VALSRGISLGLAVAALLLPARVAAQLDEGRWFTVTPVPDTATVGDSVRLRFRLTLNERDLLTDTVPHPVAELPPGVRVYSVQKLVRGSDRAFTGEAVVAFYRPGAQDIPAFGVPWVQVVTGHRGTAATEPAKIELAPVAPAGNPALRDIREPELSGMPGPLSLVLAGLAAIGIWVLVRRRRRAPAAATEIAVAPSVPPSSPSPYQLALDRLAEIERESWPDRGAVDLHYVAAIEVLRDYLGSAEKIPARERTSSELMWAMPPRLSEGGLRRLTSQLLSEADLVKFARRRPDTVAAAAHLRDTRELLRRWHETADAVR
jgi:hypothetical protein